MISERKCGSPSGADPREGRAARSAGRKGREKKNGHAGSQLGGIQDRAGKLRAQPNAKATASTSCLQQGPGLLPVLGSDGRPLNGKPRNEKVGSSSPPKFRVAQLPEGKRWALTRVRLACPSSFPPMRASRRLSTIAKFNQAPRGRSASYHDCPFFGLRLEEQRRVFGSATFVPRRDCLLRVRATPSRGAQDGILPTQGRTPIAELVRLGLMEYAATRPKDGPAIRTEAGAAWKTLGCSSVKRGALSRTSLGWRDLERRFTHYATRPVMPPTSRMPRRER